MGQNQMKLELVTKERIIRKKTEMRKRTKRKDLGGKKWKNTTGRARDRLDTRKIRGQGEF